MLELVWVLCSYGHTREDIAAALKSLLGLPNFKPKNVAAIATAVAAYEAVEITRLSEFSRVAIKPLLGCHF